MSTPTLDRFAEKVRQQRRRRWRRIALGALAVVLAGVVVWAVWFSSLLEVRAVTVVGTEHLTVERVKRVAQVPLATPLPRIDTEAIEERVAELPPVESVTVERDLPHGVRITVTERTAVAWIERDSTPWAVDATGVVYRPLNSEPDHIPQLSIDADDRREVVAAARVAADLADSSLARQVQSISAESRDSIELDLTKGRTVVWGSAQDSAAKLDVLEPLLRIDARVYDVSAPERPTTLE